jgi:lipoprotein signal peptidase
MLQQSNKTTSLARWAGVFLLGVLIAIDQFAKARAHQVFQNHAFAFSLRVPPVAMYAIYIVVVAAMLFYCLKNYYRLPRLQQLAWLLIFAGALSNIVERLFLGYVRDFIYIAAYKWRGIYNLADFYIIAGILLLLFIPKSETI